MLPTLEMIFLIASIAEYCGSSLEVTVEIICVLAGNILRTIQVL
jgi:hypothetical protein